MTDGRTRRRLCLGVAAATFLVSHAADAACRLSLALALDVSGSVDATEYRLQLDGLAEALTDPDVVQALLAIPEAPVALFVFEWSASEYQRTLQDWILLDDPARINSVASGLRAWNRGASPQATGLGAAMAHGAAQLAGGPRCDQATLDVSGDGENNDWPTPEALRSSGSIEGLRINGLVIAEGDETAASLSAYFRARVIQGPDAFVEVARGFSDYSRAMRRKLLREVQGLPVAMIGEMAQ